jgi:hypothetical protein
MRSSAESPSPPRPTDRAPRDRNPLRKTGPVTAFNALTALAVSAMLASGCGGDDEDEPVAAKTRTPTTTISIEEAARSPNSITCRDIQTQSEAAGKAALAAANALAGTVQLRDAHHYQTTQRLLFAIYDLCERIDDGSYRPAADALEAVKSGSYRLGG